MAKQKSRSWWMVKRSDPGPGLVEACLPEPAALVPGTVGISLSGGGIRAAAFGLGALQALGAKGLTKGPARADFLAAVSGGSYIASAFTTVAKGQITEDDHDLPDGHTVVTPANPFAKGSPEEHWVRSHLRYLMHGPASVLTALGRLLGGIGINVLALALLVNLAGRALGWIYGWRYPDLRATDTPGDVTADVLPGFVALAAGLAVVGALVGTVAILHRFKDDARRHSLAVVAAWMLGAAAACAVLLVGVPNLFEFLRNSDTVGAAAPELPQDEVAKASSQNVSQAALIALVGSVLTALSAMAARFGPDGGASGTERWLVRKLKPVARAFTTHGLNLLALIFGPGLLLLGLLLAVNEGAAHPVLFAPRHELLWFGLPLAVLLLMFRFGDVVAWSLHPLYKRRLADAFSLRRVQRPDGSQIVEARPYTSLLPLTDAQPDDTPELLVCAAVNISDYGRTPSGSNVAGFVFSKSTVGGTYVGTMDTATYVQQVHTSRRRDLTLPAAVSITGAAFSPSMGRMTRRPIRFLLGLLNLRLGVWIPNPSRVHSAPVKPRPWYFLRELVGQNKADSRWLYVSDGGHYENLGLVELLRRGCETVWCFDASGDKVDTFSTINTAISIARSELSVAIELDPESMAPSDADMETRAPHVRRTHVTGRIRYANGGEGTLVFVKAGVPDDAPSDVQSFHRKHPGFPCDSTINQLFTAERFDAYRTLGEHAAERAVADARRHDGTLAIEPTPAREARLAPPITTTTAKRRRKAAAALPEPAVAAPPPLAAEPEAAPPPPPPPAPDRAEQMSE